MDATTPTPVISTLLIATQSQTHRGADKSVMQIVDLQSAYQDPEATFDAASRVRFLSEELLGQIIPGHLYEFHLIDKGVPLAAPVATEVELTEAENAALAGTSAQ